MKKKFIVLSVLLPILLLGCSKNSASSNGDSSIDQTSSSKSQISSSENQESSSNQASSSSNKTSESSVVSSSTQQSSSAETIVSVASVSLNKTSMEIYLDDTDASLTATVLPETATNKNVTWSSSNTTVATVNNGKITPLKAGSTTITVKTEDGNKEDSCTLTVKEFVSIPNYVLHGQYNGDTNWTDKQMIINPSSASEYMLLGVTLYKDDLFKVHMYGDTWYGYSAIKYSTPSGLVTAGPTDDNIKVLSTGVYDIYSNYDESDGGHIYLAKQNSGSSTVNVTGISLNRTGKFMEPRHEFQLEATIYPNNASNKEVSWTSSDTSIATVTRSGRVVAKEKRGSTTITAKTADGNKTAECLIYVSPTGIPDYYLTGTISGYSRGYGNYNFAAIPLSTGKYLIPDVELISGDEITVTGANGAKLKNKYNQTYTYSVSKNMSVNVYLDINEANKNYLTFENK